MPLHRRGNADLEYRAFLALQPSGPPSEVDSVAARILPDGLATSALGKPCGQTPYTGVVAVPLAGNKRGSGVLPVAIRRESVEVWHADRLLAVFDRDTLGDWFRDPHDWLMQDDVLWVWAGGFIAVGILARVDVQPIPLPVVAELRGKL